MERLAFSYNISYRESASTSDLDITASTCASTILASTLGLTNIWVCQKMNRAFRCRLQHNSNISKIRKFFEDADTLYLLAGNAGIAFEALTPDNSCMYLVRISACDIYQLHVRESTGEDDPWKNGGIYRSIPAAPLVNFIKAREVDNDLVLDIDNDATELTLSIMSGSNVIRSIDIPLVTPDVAYEVPSMDNANVVIRVHEFKRLCSEYIRSGSEVKIEYQPEAIRLSSSGNTITHGNWDPESETGECAIDKTPFMRATKINIGNTKNSMSGIYARDKFPIIFRVKLGIIDFIICSRTKEVL